MPDGLEHETDADHTRGGRSLRVPKQVFETIAEALPHDISLAIFPAPERHFCQVEHRGAYPYMTLARLTCEVCPALNDLAGPESLLVQKQATEVKLQSAYAVNYDAAFVVPVRSHDQRRLGDWKVLDRQVRSEGS